MNDALLVRVLNRIADVSEQIETTFIRQFLQVTEFDYGNTPYEFHHEIGSTVLGLTGVKNLGDVRVLQVGEHRGACVGVESARP